MADSGFEVFQAQRQRLFGIAYRMLGSAVDAEDMVQDTWLRWQSADHAVVKEAGAFLARTVTNLCLNLLDSARSRRETYVGPWLPEPVFTGDGTLGPLDSVEQRDSVSLAILTLLENLSPAERAAYVLREAFGYSHREVAEVLATSEENARQLASRARTRITRGRRQKVDREHWQEIVTRFVAAARNGDLRALEALLAHDVTSWSDGGGVIGAARKPVQGRDHVARFTAGVFEKFTDGLTAQYSEANGEPVIAAFDGDELFAVWFIETDGVSITGLRLTLNPHKLAFARTQLSRMEALPGQSL